MTKLIIFLLINFLLNVKLDFYSSTNNCKHYCNSCDYEKNECLKCPNYKGKVFELRNKICVLPNYYNLLQTCSLIKVTKNKIYTCLNRSLTSSETANCRILNEDNKCVLCDSDTYSDRSFYKPNYYLKDEKCIKLSRNISNCIKYNSSGYCIDCFIGYKIGIDGYCEPVKKGTCMSSITSINRSVSYSLSHYNKSLCNKCSSPDEYILAEVCLNVYSSFSYINYKWVILIISLLI